MSRRRLIIGTRGSQLALFQADFIRSRLEELGSNVEIKTLKTAGDRLEQLSFEKMEGKGFFTKELEEALLNRTIDIAVHSLKDLMTTQPAGLKLGAVGYRADRRELLLIRKEAKRGGDLLPVKPGGVIGTSSVRRKCQIAHHNPSLVIKNLRGNVPTRIRRLREGQYDAILVAAAGVNRLRLDLSDFEPVYLDPLLFLPAPAQGILGLQIRENDSEVESVVSPLNSKAVALEASLERGLLKRFGAGCSLPLGVYSQVAGNRMRLKAVLGAGAGNGWGKPKQADITGGQVQAVVDEAYDILTGEAD